MTELDGRLYFRTRENGAAVFRIDTKNRNRSLELIQIANISLRKQEIRPQGDSQISDAERAEIEDWIKARLEKLTSRDKDELDRMIDQIKTTTHWIISQATPEQVDEVSEELLLTLHDMRAAIVRKKAEGMS
ncbi:MAG: hypothetical protein AAFR98_03405 [Pseudomonadota bacterium]